MNSTIFNGVPLDFDRTTLLLVSLVVIVLLIDRCWVSIDAVGQSRDGLLVRLLEVQVDRSAGLFGLFYWWLGL
jgi:hypothetical protein